MSFRQYFFDVLLKLNFTNKNKTGKGGRTTLDFSLQQRRDFCARKAVFSTDET